MHFPMVFFISSFAGAMKDNRPHHDSFIWVGVSFSLVAPSFPNTFILPQSHCLRQALEAILG